jgi:hypothetical protein
MASLGKDLAHIRKERNLSLDDVYEATKIPKRIIRSIEDDSIFNEFRENPTYIRSYIRSYAKALSIDEKDIVYALNKKEKQDYSGSLQELLENKPEDLEYEQGEEEASESTPDKDEETIHDVPDLKSEKEKRNQLVEETPAGTSEKPDVRSVDWADMGRQFQPLKTASSRTWIGISVIVFLLAIGGGIYYFYFTGSESSVVGNNQNTINQQEASEPVSTDSLELDFVSPENNDTSEITADRQRSDLQNKALEALPDTLSMILYAAYGKLEPVRVYTDIMDNINPYWVEQGEALRFTFVNEIHIRGQFSRMVLLLNGHIIQNFREQFYNPETRLLEINRSYFEGDSKWLQPAPDSLAIDAPPPTVIKERPTFN